MRNVLLLLMPPSPRFANPIDLNGRVPAPHASAGHPAAPAREWGGARRQVQSLSRRYVNTAGQVTDSDRYVDLGGLTYSASAALGTEEVPFTHDERGGYDRHIWLPSRLLGCGEGSALGVEDRIATPIHEEVGVKFTPGRSIPDGDNNLPVIDLPIMEVVLEAQVGLA